MIVRVWGKADTFDLEFTQEADGKWAFAGLPPDLTDGQYAVEIHALNTEDAIATWVGILYMRRGKLSLNLKKVDKEWLTLRPACAIIKITKSSVIGFLKGA